MARRLRILLAVDGSQNSQRLTQRVGNLVAGGMDADVVIFHAVPSVDRTLLLSAEAGELGMVFPAAMDYEETVSILRERARQAGRALVEEAREMLKRSGVPEERLQVKIVEGETDPAQAIVKEAKEGGYDLVAIGRKGRSSLREFLIGGVSDRVVRHCTSCAVLVVE